MVEAAAAAAGTQAMNVCDKYCRGCGHYRGGSGAWTCEYLLDEGHRRPCPAGEGCTCHTKIKKPRPQPFVNPMAPARKPGHQPGAPAPNRKIEPEKARELVAAGKTDAEIAASFGAAEITVRRWRNSEGLYRKEEGRPGRPPKKTDYLDKIINEEDKIMENKPEGAGETPEQKIEEVAEKAAELSAARFGELLKKTPVVVADNDEGMTVEQLASLFANMGKVGQADRVTVGGAPVRGVVVTLRYNAKNGDGPAGMTVELET